jgi:putative acetyltransferase
MSSSSAEPPAGGVEPSSVSAAASAEQTPTRIRCAQVDDRDAITTVHRLAIERLCADHYTRAQIGRWAVPSGLPPFDEVLHRTLVLVAETGGRIDGFCQLDPLTGTVQALVVHPERIGNGLGTRMLRMLEAAAREHGHREAILDSTLNAVGFYERLGYTRGAEGWTELADGTRIECVKMKRSLLLPARV